MKHHILSYFNPILPQGLTKYLSIHPSIYLLIYCLSSDLFQNINMQRTMWTGRAQPVSSSNISSFASPLQKHFSFLRTSSRQKMTHSEPPSNRKKARSPLRAPVNLSPRLCLYDHADVKGQASVIVSPGLKCLRCWIHSSAELPVRVQNSCPLSQTGSDRWSHLQFYMCWEGHFVTRSPASLGGRSGCKYHCCCWSGWCALWGGDALCWLHLCVCGQEHQRWFR